MQEASSSTIVGVFRSQSATDQAAKALQDAGLECKQMRDMIPNNSNSFFGDIKGFFTGASANTSHAGDDVSNPLLALGLSREAAQYYSAEYSQGNPILVVNAQGREQEILDILSLYGAYNAQIKSADEMQSLPNTSQKNSYEMSVPLNDTESWESYPQGQTAQETSFQGHQADTEPFNTIENLSSASPSDDQVLQADENTPTTSWYAEAPLPESTIVSEVSQPEVSTLAQEEEVSTPQTSTDPSENDVEELDTSETPTGIYAPNQEEESLAAQDNIDASGRIVEDLDTPEVQQEEEDLDTPEVQQEEEETPMTQASVSASEDDLEGFDTSAIQSDMHSYQTPQAATDVSTQAADAESSPQSITAPEQAEELQQLQDEIKLMQQQLQSAKTNLDAIKERERQYRKRQKQLQNTKKQLQNLQAEFQATQAELQETVLRVASYQNLEIEPSPKPLEKPKKSKKQKKLAVFSASE